MCSDVLHAIWVLGRDIEVLAEPFHQAVCLLQADEKVPIEVLGQVVVLPLGQDDAVVAHPQPGLAEVEGGQPRPRTMRTWSGTPV